MLVNEKSVHRIEAIQKGTLRFMLNDKVPTKIYWKPRKTVDLQRTRTLCIEIYKTINNLNPEFMKNLFKVRRAQ